MKSKIIISYILSLSVISFFALNVQAGTITGKVSYGAAVPNAKTEPMTKDCAGDVPDEHLVIGADKGIRNTIVYLEDIKTDKPYPGENARIDQENCLYKPHAVIVPAGKPLLIFSFDGVEERITHNVRNAQNESNPTFNIAVPFFKSVTQKEYDAVLATGDKEAFKKVNGKLLKKTFNEPEIFKLACDMHSWMHAVVAVAAHPYYAITDTSGNFTLNNVPAGTYTLVYWHETLGNSKAKQATEPMRKQVTVTEDGTVQADVTFAPAAPPA